MVKVTIRLEEPRDVVGVRETNEQAFGTPVEPRLVDALRDSADSVALVATIDDRVVGHILFTPVKIDRQAGSALPGWGQCQFGRRFRALVSVASSRRPALKNVVVAGTPRSCSSAIQSTMRGSGLRQHAQVGWSVNSRP